MIRCEVGRTARWSKLVQAVALGIITSVVYSGCVGGGGSGGGVTGISDEDDHGDVPLSATVVIPDGANIRGQINFPGDSDWFRFRGIAGVGYVLQISGFPPDPDVRPDLDLTGDGTRVLIPKITNIDGATQLVSTSGSDGGEPYDVNPAGVEGGEGFVIIGDTRVMWVCPTIGDYFFRIEHEREITGIGAYEIRLATSQLMTIDSSDTILQSGTRFVFLATQNGEVFQNDFMSGGLQYTFLEYEEAITATTNGFSFYISDVVFLPMATDPEPVVVHAHYGFPNIFLPEWSSNRGEVDHPRFGEVEFQFRRRQPGDEWTEEFAGKLSDGSEIRMPVSVRLNEPLSGDPEGMIRVDATFHPEDAVGDSRGGIDICCTGGSGLDFNPGVVRSVTAFDWFLDLHPQPDMELDPLPIAVSRPFADTYQMFESHLQATSDNVVLNDGSRLPEDAQRGLAPFIVYYDASLKLFQVATQTYEHSLSYPYPGNIFNPDYTPYVGDRVRVHAGGPGEAGPSIINVGTLPPIIAPPTVRLPNVIDVVAENPGFRAPIRQLTDAEAEELRDAYYDGGVYIEITDSVTGEQLVRAEGLLEISFFPTLEPCSFPPCSGVEPADSTTKGTVTFASSLPDGTSINLYANGELLGALSEPVAADAAVACGFGGSGHTLATELYPGTYYWHAHDKDGGDYSGHVTVQSGGCTTVIIGPGDLDSEV